QEVLIPRAAEVIFQLISYRRRPIMRQTYDGQSSIRKNFSISNGLFGLTLFVAGDALGLSVGRANFADLCTRRASLFQALDVTRIVGGHQLVSTRPLIRAESE